MKKNVILLLVIFLVTVMHHTAIGGSYLNTVDSQMMVMTNVHNNNAQDIENARTTLYIPELGFYWSSGTFDLDAGEHVSKFMFPEVPDAAPGAYRARVSVSSQNTRASDWTWLIID